MADSVVHESAESLWRALIARAGLDVGEAEATGRGLFSWRRARKRPARVAPYDVGLVDDLRAELFGSAEGSLLTLLQTAQPPISAETLLRAFFKALQPFALMKVGILEMLSAAGARESDSKIKIRFQFDESDDPLDLLLQDFREQIETIERVNVEVTTRAWTSADLWRLQGAAEDLIGREDKLETRGRPGDDQIAEWFARYRTTNRYERFPEVPPLGIDPLDARLRDVTDLLQDMLAAFRRHGGDRDALRNAGNDPAVAATIDPIGMSVRDLYFLESDYWAGAMARWLLRVRAAAANPDLDRARLAAGVTAALDAIFPPAIGPKALVERLRSELDQIVNLPIWKKRNEVYAVWISTQIWQALKGIWQFRFHTLDGTLSFAFRGVHLATLTGPNPNDVIQWWTELRTTATRLPSGKRTTGIQPDYRLLRAPFSDPGPDVLIVEVKQYKQSGKANFVAAIEDYAYACPNARVILATYGPISAPTAQALSPRARQRTELFAHARPGRAAEAAALREAIARAVPIEAGAPPAALPKPAAGSEEGAAGIGRVQLTWGASPRDLDLHILGDDSQSPKRIDVHYGDPIYRTQIAYVGDVTTGFGPETVSFDKPQGRFLVCVHQFSADGSLASGDIALRVFGHESEAPERFVIRCSGNGSGRWWIACRLDCFSGTVTPVDRIVPDPRMWRVDEVAAEA